MGLVRFVAVQKHDPELFKSSSNESLEICFCFSGLLRRQKSVQKRKQYHCFCFRKTLRSGLIYSHTVIYFQEARKFFCNFFLPLKKTDNPID